MLSHLIGFSFVFPIIALIYFLIPKQHRYIWLAAVSYAFYTYVNAGYTAVLFLLTLITYVSSKYMDGRYRKLAVTACVTGNIGILCFIKYYPYIFSSVNNLLSYADMRLLGAASDIIFPIGMSYYTLQTIGYIIDVYRGKTKPETNFIKYALFVSFFPTVLSGPIQRSSVLLKQIQEGTDFNYNGAKKGLMMIAFGAFQKILISNQIAKITSMAYADYRTLNGSVILFAIILFGIQVYCDFAGYSNMAIGTAKLLGFNLDANFRQPYFASGFRDFWKRWHISLSSWLKDYVYISLCGNRKGAFRKNLNIMLTFIVSSVWHGINANYCIFVILLGLLVVFENLTDGLKNKLNEALKIKTDCFSYKLFNIIITFFCINFLWIFFMPQKFSESMQMIEKILFQFSLGDTLSNSLYIIGGHEQIFNFLLLKLTILFIVDLIHEYNISITDWLNNQNIVFRWICYIFIAVMLFIAVFNNYADDAQDFLYIKF